MGEMLMQFQIQETCPRCGKPVVVASITPHPARPDRALHSFECAKCGPVRTTEILLAPEARP
jgi:ribosomal protein S27AE